MAAEAASTARAWHAMQPDAAAVWLAALTVPWWIAGGWALASWAVLEAKDGTLTRLHAGRLPRAAVHWLWCRRADDGPWTLELMLDEAQHDRWVYRRHPAIQAPLTQAVRRAANGNPYFAPEVQILYKACAVRARDQADFDRIAPRLDGAARSWLQGALAQAEPNHRWLTMLRAT